MSPLPPSPSSDPRPDPFIDSALRDALRTPELSAEALERMRVRVESEWRRAAQEHASLASRMRRVFAVRHWQLAATVLVCVSAALALTFWRVNSRNAVPLGTLAFASSGSVAQETAAGSVALAEGSVLQAGDALSFRDFGRIVLTHGGSLRMAPGTRIRVLDSDHVALDAGRLYAEFAPLIPRVGKFTVQTFAGSIEHRGTQFEVSIQRDVHVRVREGRVRFYRQDEAQSATAGVELVVPAAGAIERRAIARDAGEWTWIQAAAPGFDIESHSLYEFLQWVASETGKQVSFDADAEQVARATQLHGSVQGLLPMAALTRVLSTTTLKCNVRAESIRISKD